MKVIIAILISLFATALQAKEAKVLIPFGPGGGVDLLFRNLEKFGKQQGVTLVPEYVPGAEGVVGMNKAMDMPKDTLILTTSEVLASKGSPAKRFDSLRSFEYITGIRSTVFALVRNDRQDYIFGYNSPTQKELVEQYIAEKNIKDHIMVPYKTIPQILNDLVNNTISMAIIPASLIVQNPKVEFVKLIEGYSEFALVMPAGADTSFWSKFIKDYMDSDQAKADAKRDLMILKPFGKKRIIDLVSKNL